jgi:hypothetical protein
MWTRRLAVAGLAAAVIVVFEACGSESQPAGPTGQGLTTSEAAALNQQIVGMVIQGWGFDGTAPSLAPIVDEGVSLSVASAPVTFDWAVDVTTPCDQGGTFDIDGAISGTIDDQTLAGSLQVNVATSLTNCGLMLEGQVFTFNTDPALQFSGSNTFDAEGLVGTSTYTYVGGLGWAAADGRSGNCQFDVRVTLQADGAQAATGTVCGHSVNSTAGL